MGTADPADLTPTERRSVPRRFELRPRNSIGPIIGFLHPSEMTPEERMDELAAIFAAGFLHLRAGMAFPESQGETAGAAADKVFAGTESSLEPVSETRLCGSQKERIE